MQISDNIRLEALDLCHAQDVFSALDSNRDTMREWLPFVDLTNRIEDSIEFIQLERMTTNKTYAVIFKGQFVGLAGIKDINLSDLRAEIGYWIVPGFQNQGIATSVSHFLTDYAFDELGLNRMQIRVGVNNAKSNRVATKLGYVLEGIEREGEKEVWGFSDINVYSLLKREWETR